MFSSVTGVFVHCIFDVLRLGQKQKAPTDFSHNSKKESAKQPKKTEELKCPLILFASKHPDPQLLWQANHLFASPALWLDSKLPMARGIDTNASQGDGHHDEEAGPLKEPLPNEGDPSLQR